MSRHWRLPLLVVSVLLLFIVDVRNSADAGAQQTIEWYRNNNIALPQAQLAVEPGAPEQNIWQDVDGRALLAQIKYELATGSYWKFRKQDRDAVVAILDDPGTRFVYTGKRGKLNTTTGAQTIDDKTIKVHHAAVSWDWGPNKDKLRPLFDIGSILFHEAVHAHFFRSGVFEPLQELPVRHIERELATAAARFSPDEMAELSRFAADPAGYKPSKSEDQTTAEAEAPETPTMPVYDDADLIAVFGVLRDRANKTRQGEAEAKRRCYAMGTREERTAAIEKTIDDGVRAPQSFRDMMRADEEFATRLTVIEDELQLLQSSAVEQGEKACELTRQETPDLEAVSAAEAEIDSIAEAARGLLSDARDIGADLSASLSGKSSVPSIEVFDQAIEADISAKVDACNRTGDIWSDHVDDILAMYPSGGVPKNKETLRRAHELLLEAEAANYEHADVYRQRYNQYNAEFNKKEPDKRLADCASVSRWLPRACTVLGIDLRAKKRQAVEEFEAAREAILARRADQLARISSGLTRMRRTVFEIGFAKVAAMECIEVAEKKRREKQDPQLAEEAARIADPGTLQCDVADIDRRISELRATKFANTKTAGDLITRLQNKRAAIEAARARFADAGGFFNDGEIDETLRELQAARDELAKLNGAPACVDLANKVAKGESQAEALRETLSAANAALSGKCSSRDIEAALERIGAREKPPVLVKVRQRLERASRLRALYNRAGRAHKNGRYNQAFNLLQQGSDAHRSAGGDCPILGQSIANGLAKVQSHVDQRTEILSAAENCNELTLREALAGDGVVVKAMRVDIQDALQTCEVRSREREQRAERNRTSQCEDKHGAGFFPTTPNDSGTFHCVPTQSAADRWCRENNKGVGWSAKNIRRTGGFDCVQDRRSRMAEAKARCLQNARDTNRVYAHVTLNSDGTSTCHTCKKGTVYKNGRCHGPTRRVVRKCKAGYVLRGTRCYRVQTRQRQQRRTTGRRYACSISNPDGSLLGGGGTTSTIYTNRPVSGYRCVRIR